MLVQDSYKFPVSLSVEAFINKEVSNSMIGSGKDEENRKIRKLYGYERGISFYRVEVTAKTLLEQLLEGRVFCHLFNPKQYRQDGTFGSSEKTNDNFAGSYVIGVDIDETKYNTVRDYVANLTLKPSFYYTSYSNKQLGKGARFRLIYVFEEKIDNPYFFRYCASLLNKRIEADVKEEIKDNCNLRCSQYFNGTCKYNSSVILDYGYSGLVYSLEDIGASKEGYNNFLGRGADFKTQTKQRKEDIERLIEGIVIEPEQPQEDKEPVCSPQLVEDMKYLSYDEFMKRHRREYKLTYRTEGEDWENDTYQKAPEGYFSLYWNAVKVKDGQKRRKKLFERICLRRVINPSIDANTLLFNAYEDRYRFFEIDQDLSIECLVRNVETALELEIQDIELMYSENLKYLRGKKDSNGYIFKKGEYNSKADLKAVTWSVISENYNTSKTVKENLEIIQEKVNVSLRTLYRYCEENGIKYRVTDEELKELIDLTKSSRENEKALRSEGIKVQRKRLLRLIKELK